MDWGIRCNFSVAHAVLWFMQALAPKAEESSWFFEAIGEIGDFGSRLFRNFVKVSLFVLGLGLALTFAVYLGIRGMASWRMIAACSATVFMCGGLLVLSGANLAVLLSLAETVRAKNLARRVLDRLFAELIGVTDANPHGDYEQTQKLHGMPVEELRAELKRAGNRLLENRVACVLPRFIRWLVTKAQRLLVWATVRAVISYGSAKADSDCKVDLLALRENLASVVDDLVTRRITEGARRLAMLAALIVSLASWGVVAILTRI